MRRLNFLKLLGLVLASVTWEVSYGQQLTAASGTWPGRPIEGSTGGLYLPNQLQSSVQSDLHPGIRMHKDPFGKPCVTVAAYSLPKIDFRKIFGAEGSEAEGSEEDEGQNASASKQGNQSKIFEHMISAQNRCGQSIKLKICYYDLQDCVTVDVPGHGKEQASLGAASGMSFRYQYNEQF